MHTIKLIAIICASMLIAAACSEQGGQAPTTQSMPPTPVSYSVITTTTIQPSVPLPGRVVALRQSQVRPQVQGIITELLFEQGSLVTKDQQLYQIDDARYNAQLKSAQADLKSAEASLKTLQAKTERYKDLLAKKAVSEQEYDDIVAQTDQAKAAIGVANAQISLAQVDLEFTKVYAPITGVISRSYVTEGALVTASQSQQLATITQLDPIYVDMQLSGPDALEIRQSMVNKEHLPVKIFIDNSKAYEHVGELKFSEVTVDQSTGAVTLRAQIPNPDKFLLPGMFVEGEIVLPKQQALLLPQRATIRQPDGSLTVYIVNNENKVEARTVSYSRIYKDKFVVTDGIKEGDKVIITGYLKVRPGASVSPQPWEA